MCGIVGNFSKRDARKIVIEGLEKLEYRGYDSAGIAIVDEKNELKVFKTKGRVADLKEIVDYKSTVKLAIGHTRWATHGVPNDINAHPHKSQSGRFCIVHNGVIDNYKKIKLEYLSKYTFVSETDTEVIINLVEEFSKKMSIPNAIKKTMSILEGSYAIIIIDSETPDKMYFAKNKTPMIIGKGVDGVTIGSDIMALIGHADEYTLLEDKTFGIANDSSFELFDIIGLEREYTLKPITIKNDDIDKGPYDHFMLKEIHEQPFVIRNLLSKYYPEDDILIDERLINEIKSCDKINFVACGTSMHASYMAKYYFEKLCGIPSEVFCASELVYSTPLISAKPFFIFLSQSGETADSISVMKNVRKNHHPILTITNNAESSMGNLSNYVLDICAGKEIAVASTKAYVAQVVVCSLLAKAVSGARTNLKSNLNRVAIIMEELLANEDMYKDIASKIITSNDAFYIGRGIDYWTSLESSLKLKEISYIHSEGYSSGELKHGPIALITNGTPVIALITQEGTNSITRSNLIETKSRGAKTFTIVLESLSNPDDDIIIPNVAHYLTPLVTVIVTQFIAYYAAVLKGNDVDKPKNLAKSVTVE